MAIAIPSPQPHLSSRGIYFSAVRRLAAIWSIVTLIVSIATYLTVQEAFGASLIIAFASGIISAVALEPFRRVAYQMEMVQSVNRLADGNQGVDSSLVTAFLAAMAIRVTGTVALFLLCSYELHNKMGLPQQRIALFVCGWYVLLTSAEVSLLVQSVRSLGKISLSQKSLTKKTESN